VCLRAYNQEKDPTRKANIYKASISKRFDGVPQACDALRATNTLGTVSGEVIVQRTLELLKWEFPLLSRITTDFTAEAVPWNTEVNSRIITVPSVSSYVAGTGYTTEDTTTTDVPVSISNHKSTQVTFNANELAGTFRRLFSEQDEAMHYAIADDMVDTVLALITTAFTATQELAGTSPAGALTRSTLIAAATTMTTNKNPIRGRVCLLNPTQYGNLADDTDVTDLGTRQQAGIVTDNVLPRVAGFDVMQVGSMPSTSNLEGFCFTKSALVLATRLPNDYANALPGATGGGTVQVITNPDTGMAIQLVQYVDHAKAEATMRLAWMFGCARGQIAAGLRLIDAT
jgi:hypothetical protein